MKQVSFQTLTILLLLLIGLNSCKKEANLSPTRTEPVPESLYGVDLSHLESNYLCNSIEFIDYPYGSGGYATRRDTNDLIVQCFVDGCTLTVMGQSFQITSPTQTSFTDNNYGGSYGGQVTLKSVSFSNNYNSISMTYYTNNGHGQDDVYSGTKTSLAPTSPSNPHLDSLVGQYLLSVREYNFQTGLDTIYTDTLSVTRNSYGGDIIINNKTFEFSRFYSSAKIYHRYEYWTNNGEVIWHNGNLDLTYHKNKDYVSPTDPANYEYYHYSGSKL